MTVSCSSAASQRLTLHHKCQSLRMHRVCVCTSRLLALRAVGSPYRSGSCRSATGGYLNANATMKLSQGALDIKRRQLAFQAPSLKLVLMGLCMSRVEAFGGSGFVDLFWLGSCLGRSVSCTKVGRCWQAPSFYLNQGRCQAVEEVVHAKPRRIRDNTWLGRPPFILPE